MKGNTWREMQMDAWREIHLFNEKSVEIHNTHALNWKTYHADEKMVSRFSFSNSTMRCMAFRQDDSTHFGATVTLHNCGHHVVHIFCIFALPPDAFGALGWCHLCEFWVETFWSSYNFVDSFCRQCVTKIKAVQWERDNALTTNDSTHKHNIRHGQYHLYQMSVINKR